MRQADMAGASLIRQAPGGGHRDGAASRGRLSEQIFKKKRASRYKNRRLYRDCECCDDPDTAEIKAPRLLCAAMCSRKLRPHNFSEKQKRHFRRLYEDRTVVKSAFVFVIWN